MKVKIFVVCILLLAFTLVTRFVSINWPWPKPENTLPPCAPAISALCQNQVAANQLYIEKIKPIFKEKCLMCHGTVDKVPLYSIIPPASFLVKDDQEEAKENLDMTFDYPFKGSDDDPEEKVLHHLKRTIEKNEMPPLIYKVMHWKSGLTVDEKKVILEWVNSSQEFFRK